MSQSRAVGPYWRHWRDRFAQAGMDTPALDARLLAGHVLGLDASGLALAEHETLSHAMQTRLDGLGQRRLAGEPIARILGCKEFYGREFALNGATLVPRPDTEVLVDAGIGRLKQIANPRFLELGVGSGCVAVTLLAQCPTANGVGTDISPDALAMSGANAQTHDVASRLELRQGAWFSPLMRGERFDLIVSNPPYIAHAEIAGLAVDVREFDPAAALDGGPDGLDAYRSIAKDGARWLTGEGQILVEIGFDQAAAVRAIFEAHGFVPIDDWRDLGGHERVLGFVPAR